MWKLIKSHLPRWTPPLDTDNGARREDARMFHARSHVNVLESQTPSSDPAPIPTTKDKKQVKGPDAAKTSGGGEPLPFKRENNAVLVFAAYTSISSNPRLSSSDEQVSEKKSDDDDDSTFSFSKLNRGSRGHVSKRGRIVARNAARRSRHADAKGVARATASARSRRSPAQVRLSRLQESETASARGRRHRSKVSVDRRSTRRDFVAVHRPIDDKRIVEEMDEI